MSLRWRTSGAASVRSRRCAAFSAWCGSCARSGRTSCIASRCAWWCSVGSRRASAARGGWCWRRPGSGMCGAIADRLRRVARALARLIVGHWLKGPDTRYLFENTDDPREFGLDPGKPPVTIVPGAGVDPDEFSPSPEPASAAGEGRGGGAHDRPEGHRGSGRGGAQGARARGAGRTASLRRAGSVEPALL